MDNHPKKNGFTMDGANHPVPVTLSVIIPALNEEDGISEILSQILAVKEELATIGIAELEVIVVDDGSDDATADIVERTHDVLLVRHHVNRGYGAAIKTGFRRATGELLAFLDADNTYPPKYLVQLCETALTTNADIVTGSRRSMPDTGMPAIRRLGNLFWSLLLSLIGSERVRDPASGMRVIWRRCLPKLYPLPDGLNFTPVMSTRSLHERLQTVEIPISYKERSGRSKLSVIKDGTRFLHTILWTALQYNPARIMECAGFGALAVSVIIGVLLIAARLRGITVLEPWSVFVIFLSLIFAVAGVSAFSLGISFNYLVSLLHHNPIRQKNLMEKVLGSAPERNFGWIGLGLAIIGIALGSLSLILGLGGWEITRLWLWQLGSALFLLVGTQIILFWLLIRVMATLSRRNIDIQNDLTGSERIACSQDYGDSVPQSSGDLLVASK